MITTHFTPGSKSTAAPRSARAIRLACVGVLLAGCLGVGAASCVDPEATFYVIGPTAGTATMNTMGGGFSVLCEQTGVNIAEVYVETCHGVAVDTGQIAACFGVRSELVPAASISRIESRSIVLTEADTTLSGSSGEDLGGKFAVSGVLDPTAPGTIPTTLALGVTLGKGADYAAFVSGGTAQGSLILHGRTTGNLNLETPRYDFQAEVVTIETCAAP